MFPRIPGLGLPTYGLLVALAFVVALLLAERLARRHGMSATAVADVAVSACLAGIVGAKLLLLVLEPSLLRRPWEVLFQGGVFYGGLIAAVAWTLVRCRQKGLRVHEFGDILAAPLAIGHALGRVGCFLAGCCWGRACDLPWAVHYTNPDSLPAQSGISPLLGLHPTQLYEAAGNVALGLLALWVLEHRRFVGQAWWSYVAAYGLFRVVIEEFRGDPRGEWLDGRLSTSQIVGLLAFAVAIVMLGWCRRAARRASPEAAA